MIARNSLNANVPRCPWARARLALPASAGFPAARMWLRCQFVTGCLRLLFAGGCLPCVRGRARARCGVWLLGLPADACGRVWPVAATYGCLWLHVVACGLVWSLVAACGCLRLGGGWRLAAAAAYDNLVSKLAATKWQLGGSLMAARWLLGGSLEGMGRQSVAHRRVTSVLVAPSCACLSLAASADP